MSLRHTAQEPRPAEHSNNQLELSSGDKFGALGGAVVLALLGVSFAAPWRTPPDAHTPVTDQIFYRHTHTHEYMLLFGVLLAAFLLQPAFAAAAARLRGGRRAPYVALVLLALCCFICGFLIHEGRHQFGGFDFSGLIVIGWRQILGQRPYLDFIAPTPPGFDLGIKYAFEIFGVSWNANLYLSAVFACATMLWMYWLMRVLQLGRTAAVAVAFAVECQTMLLLGFWWYNNSATVLAAVFLLACLAYARRPRSVGVQISYLASLALLALMKPNVAGITIVGGVALLLIATELRLRLALLTIGAAAATLAILWLNHISVSALLSSYHEASRNRGGLSYHGFSMMTPAERMMAVLAVCSLSIPGLWLLPRTLCLIKAKDFRGAALFLFVPLAALITVYSMMTNGEFWLVECPPLLAAVAYFTYSLAVPPKLIRRFFTSLVCAAIAASLFIGAVRLRVFTIGADQFFEWTNNEHLISSGFLKDMRVGLLMTNMEDEIASALRSSPGPYFFGPRIDFNYAVHRVPPPEHLAVWWDPGTSFGYDREPHLVQIWKDSRFQTLIFLKGDYTYYPASLLDAIHQNYEQDDRYPLITVYHRRSVAP